MIISVASGKGGTGKTTVAANLSASLENSVYVDCDVEEPNGALLLKPQIENSKQIFKKLPKVDPFKCTFCGKCKEVCEFNAIIILPGEVMVLDELCHSCGACSYFCPTNAISEIYKNIGVINLGKSESITFIEGILNVGEATATPLIRELIKSIDKKGTTIIDAPPGTSCSMVESVKESDFCILVTESTPFGLHDLSLAVKVVRDINIPFGVIVNKYDKSFNELDEYLEKEKIDVMLRLPFDKNIAKLYSEGKLLLDLEGYKNKFESVFEEIYAKIGGKNR